jgi:hypothetical protein
MTVNVQGVLDRMALAERMAAKLVEPDLLPMSFPADAEERGWLVVAAQRLAAALAALRARVEQGLILPELRSLRVEREQRLEQEWVAAVRHLFEALVREVGPTSPLVESLFPHQRFEKLDRGGAALRTFRAEFEVRRASSYVRRLEADPEHPRLAALLEGVERARAALVALTTASDAGTAEALRANILEAGRVLERALQQARALCEAALIDHPERLLELRLNERAKKRSAREFTERDAEPA